jgi:chemotaxis protein MotB
MAAGSPIIIKKKSGHAGHHGGAWKVAYADFVTALMALFIVLWLMNTSKKVQEGIGGYFRDPTGTGKMTGTQQANRPTGAPGENLSITKDNMPELKDQLEQSLHKMADFNKLKNQIDMTVTAEGLRIELMETETGTFFDTGKPTPNAQGKELLIMLAAQLKDLPNFLSIEGHTDSRPYSPSSDYGNWELSTDRANSARRLMQQNGLRPNQVSQVRGFAAQRPRKPDAPQDASNRRISVIVQYLDGEKKDGDQADKTEPGKHEPEKKGPEKEGHH